MEQIGPYRIVREIARGGMGAVFHGRGPQGNEVAIKLLLAQRAENPVARQRFQLEIRTLAKLRHPNVVSILAVGEHDGVPWLALEYVAGDTLHNRLREGPLSIDASIELARHVAQALAYVHGCGVLHRDLKPDNLLLQGERVLLTDFGLSLEHDTSQSRFTATGIFLGTPGYWSPEQARVSRHDPGPYTDLFGLGAVLYACLTGSPPIRAGSLYEHLEVERFHKIVAPHRLRPEVPRWLSKLCMRCLAFEPKQRPASAEEVARTLLLGEESGRPARSVEASGSPHLLVGIAFAVTALVSLSGVVLWIALAAEPTPPSRPVPTAQPEVSAPSPAPDEETKASELDVTEVDVAEVDVAEVDVAEVDVAEVDALRARATALNDEGRLEDAIQVLNQVRALVPSHAETYVRLGAIKSRLERPEEALADLNRAIELDPGAADAFLTRTGVLFQLGRVEDAIADCGSALEAAPDNVEALNVRSLLNLHAKHHAAAIRDFDRLLELDPTNLDFRRKRAEALSTVGRYADLIPDLDRVLQANPTDSPAFATRGYAKAKLERYREAIDDYSRALELDPSLVEAYVDRGVSRRKLRLLKAAVADFSRALEREPKHFRAALNRALTRNDLGDYAGVIEDFDRVLTVRPRQPGAHTQRGLAKFRSGNPEEAIPDFDRALELDPRDAMAYVNRGMCQFKLGRYREALADYDRVLEAKLLSGEQADRVRQLRADALAKLRD